MGPGLKTVLTLHPCMGWLEGPGGCGTLLCSAALPEFVSAVLGFGHGLSSSYFLSSKGLQSPEPHIAHSCNFIACLHFSICLEIRLTELLHVHKLLSLLANDKMGTEGRSDILAPNLVTNPSSCCCLWLCVGPGLFPGLWFSRVVGDYLYPLSCQEGAGFFP